MVFFNCHACGESLKKNQVEKHYQFQCRKCEVVSCVDCSKEFWGDTFKEHTKCISEEEKYSGKNWKPKPGANKGEQKQERWIEQVQTAIAKCPAGKPHLRTLLQQIKDYPNIPRKQAKFENFVKNSMRVHDSRMVTAAWDILSAELNAKPTEEETVQNGTTKTTSPKAAESDQSQDNSSPADNEESDKKLSKRERKELRREKQHKVDKKHKKLAETVTSQQDEKKTKKGKKRRHDEDEDEEREDTEESLKDVPHKKKKKKKHQDEAQSNGLSVPSPEGVTSTETVPEPQGKFQWEATIITVLKKAPDHEIKLKKLQKKLLSEFHASGGDGKYYTEEKLHAKIIKEIKKNPELKVHKERVKLKH